MPILTLTSDTGGQDFVAGAVKGILLQHTGNHLTLIDVSHNLAPFNLPHAAYICRNIIKNYPAGSYHAILVDLFGGNTDRLLAVEKYGQVFFCADNGLVSMMLDEKPDFVAALPYEKKFPKSILGAAAIIGSTLQQLENGHKLEEISENFTAYEQKHSLRPMSGPGWLEGQIIFTDHFENVVVNITREVFEEHRAGRSFKIVFKRDEIIDRLSETYGDVPQGEKLALFNSAGFLEIAINQGNAAGLFGLKGLSGSNETEGNYRQNRLFYQTVKIFFA